MPTKVVDLWPGAAGVFEPGRDTPGVEQVTSAPGVIIVKYKTLQGEYAGSSSYKYSCLPEAVDPRGLKGK